MLTVNIVPFEINKIISEMQNGKSSDIPISVIKKTFNIISPILAHHFNYLMGTGKFPDIIKLGKITPIFKKEDEQLLNRNCARLPLFAGAIFPSPVACDQTGLSLVTSIITM